MTFKSLPISNQSLCATVAATIGFAALVANLNHPVTATLAFLACAAGVIATAAAIIFAFIYATNRVASLYARYPAQITLLCCAFATVVSAGINAVELYGWYSDVAGLNISAPRALLAIAAVYAGSACFAVHALDGKHKLLDRILMFTFASCIGHVVAAGMIGAILESPMN